MRPGSVVDYSQTPFDWYLTTPKDGLCRLVCPTEHGAHIIPAPAVGDPALRTFSCCGGWVVTNQPGNPRARQRRHQVEGFMVEHWLWEPGDVAV